MSTVVDFYDPQLAQFLEETAEILSKKLGRKITKGSLVREAIIFYLKEKLKSEAKP